MTRSRKRPLPKARTDNQPFGEVRPSLAVDIPKLPTGQSIGDRVSQEMPSLGQMVSRAHFEVLSASRRFHSATRRGAATEIANQATNDFNDLVFDLLDARGRPATRAARALIEHLVNLSDVVSNTELAERYLAHATLMPILEAEAKVGVALLTGSERQAEEHRLKSLGRRHKAAAEAAISKYGNAFRRSWAPDTLYTRAGRHGFQNLYHYYRLSSQVLHGAAGGAMGSVKEIEGKFVHRSGPALALLPLAYYEGLQAFKAFLKILAHLSPSVDMQQASDAVGALLAAWPAYRKAVRNVDRWLWPETPPTGPLAILGVSRSGTRRWFCHEPELGLIVEAIPPNESQFAPGQRERLEQLAERAKPTMFANQDQWVTVAVAGVIVNPKPGARWINSAAILVHDSFGRRLEEPVIIDLDVS